ncbi:hypothetical protein A2630_03115 [Candidatus Woesebacteria bacterium RIFCSPHIGHO2_01_FULL_44_10]|uniref:Antitoxin n=1 Tax=Candidatus Woesebacteria bacterium RIFCSPLOWO2_01_FULL_44_14 TaxID=1802525 RepID=A0A1F8BXD5_9BACT|nr:MAG: hypothetical protein A2630_03115 [Candidatus Woesebacteria bacterium RIFCSPHIGHO2_01_FULL_44_10]OGM56314.1 MAG: hypothetical protein A3F62_05010 [Candidatus Woesebacteria bacterium RIFCSPHIGHO2_12_FULL_44_11]OGM68771.1 MAG: hypothetical protein A2975_02860 [Candidatus Woesebacteria bacterium RIFCSPLOWO2_01_FULL_44_14]
MTKVTINKYIVADPRVCHGKPTFAGTRVMVWQILEMLAAGESAQDILEEYPTLSQEHIRAALEYAGSLTKENYVILNLAP